MTFTNFLGLHIFFKLSGPGNCCFKISRLFRVFHDRMTLNVKSGLCCVCVCCVCVEREKVCMYE